MKYEEIHYRGLSVIRDLTSGNQSYTLCETPKRSMLSWALVDDP